ncbi:MAG TPA: ABC transporter permease [Candidatus Dormibacteraeota bacterium]
MGLVVLVAIGLTAHDFTSAGNIQNLLRAVAIIGIAALGQTFVIASRGIDLSVGQLMGLVSVLAVGFMHGDASLIIPVVCVTLALGVAVGIFNGVAIVTTGIHPMILTFGMLSALKGIIFLYTDRTRGSVPPVFRQLDLGQLGPLPWSVVILGVGAVVCWFVFTHTTFGRYVIAVGSNEPNARKAGISVGRIRVAVYAISGLSGAVAGLILAARLGTGFPLAGQGLELSAIVAVVLGGTSFAGGRGRMLGTVGGALLLVLLSNILNLKQVAPYVQDVITGMIVLAAITLYTARRAR